MRALRRTLLFAGALALLGCAAPDPSRFAGERPELDPRRFFDGRLTAWGLFEPRFGGAQRRFVATIDARWNGDVGTLDERFVWNDGSRERRVWTLRPAGEGRWTGTADDVVGQAEGIAAGHALSWRYVLALPVGERVWHVDFDDRMYLIDEHSMINRATIRKFGVTVGELTVLFRRGDATAR